MLSKAAEEAYPETEWTQHATILAFREAFDRGAQSVLDRIDREDEVGTPEGERGLAGVIEDAMHGREGGAVPSGLPRSYGGGARAWGEADDYWITMHAPAILRAVQAYLRGLITETDRSKG